MFSSLKIFSFVSLIIVIGITFFVGSSFRDRATEYLANITKENNISIANGYVGTVWRNSGDIVPTIKTRTPDDLSSDNRVIRFAQETVLYFKKMSLMRANIYDANGFLILSTDVNGKNNLPDNTPSPDTNSIGNVIQKSEISSNILQHVDFKNGKSGVVIQTLFPIAVSGVANGKPEGIVEIITDVTSPISDVLWTQLVVSGYLIGAFIIFLAILLLMSRRAEAIIAKQHEANIELAAAASAAQTESRDKSLFLANISHELRTPLNAIIGFSEIIKNHMSAEGNETELSVRKFDDYVNDIHSSGVHLLSLINDILDYSKAEAGKLELELSEINANKLIHNCVRLVTPRAEKAQVRLVESLPKDAIKLVTDSKKFKQILLNLLSNAIKFTPPEGEVRVSAWASIGEKSYTFEVRDSGIGIAPKDISRAMSPFGQVDSALSRQYEGTGLGLPLTKKFVELMGGKFNITSEIGEGTTITFTLPYELSVTDGVIIKQASE